jgi:hypothetical protein
MDIDMESMITLFLLSLICILALANYTHIKFKEYLTISVLNNDMRTIRACENAIYHLLDMILTKDSLLNNQYDGIILSIEQNTPSTQDVSFYT